MSGVDEQHPEYNCPKCGGTRFSRVDYGAIKIRVNTAGEGTYNEGTFSREDYDDWECRDCYTTAYGELRDHIRRLERELS